MRRMDSLGIIPQDRSPDLRLIELVHPSRSDLQWHIGQALRAYSYGVVADSHRASRASCGWNGFGFDGNLSVSRMKLVCQILHSIDCGGAGQLDAFIDVVRASGASRLE